MTLLSRDFKSLAYTISPPRQRVHIAAICIANKDFVLLLIAITFHKKAPNGAKLEAEVGIEPAYAALQAAT
jgi:hypothetical protein